MIIVLRNVTIVTKVRRGEKMNFGQELADLRIELGLTQHAFAQILKFTQSAVSAWERNLAKPDKATQKIIKELASAQGLKADFIEIKEKSE